MTTRIEPDAMVERLESFHLGDSTQWALIRGRRATSPVLLLIQAGPGLPMIHEASAHRRQLDLEEHFRVVYWDQRGTGKSFDPGAECSPTLAGLVEDVRAMIAALCDRLGVAQLDVVGFSLGASLALLAAHEGAAPIHSPHLRRPGREPSRERAVRPRVRARPG